MKNIIRIIVLSVILILLGFSAYFGYKSYLESRNPIDVVMDYTNEVKVRREYVFQEPTVKDVTKEVSSDPNPRVVQLYIGNGNYYKIYVPSNDIILTDYNTYVYNSDNSYSIQVMSGVNKTNMSSMFGIKKPEKLSRTVIKTKYGERKPQIAGVLLFDDIAICVRTYDNPVAFETILNGLMENRVKKFDYKDPKVDEKAITYSLPNQILTSDIYPFSVSPNNFNTAGTKQYNLSDGQLTQFSMLQSFDNAKKEMYDRINVATDGNCVITAQCVTQGSYYAEFGDFTVFINSKTVNKSNCFLGQGKEARYNIAMYYKQYCK